MLDVQFDVKLAMHTVLHLVCQCLAAKIPSLSEQLLAQLIGSLSVKFRENGAASLLKVSLKEKLMWLRAATKAEMQSQCLSFTILDALPRLEVRPLHLLNILTELFRSCPCSVLIVVTDRASRHTATSRDFIQRENDILHAEY